MPCTGIPGTEMHAFSQAAHPPQPPKKGFILASDPGKPCPFFHGFFRWFSRTASLKNAPITPRISPSIPTSRMFRAFFGDTGFSLTEISSMSEVG
jgi:hypothetical protein